MTLSLYSDLYPLNILNLAPSIGRQSGGLGPTLIELTRAQCALGQNATIWTLDPPEEIDWIIRTSGLSTWNLASFPIRGPHQIGYSPAMERAVDMIGATFDVWYQHSIWMANSRATTRWHEKYERPTVVAVAGTLEDYALKRSTWRKRLATVAYERRNLTEASCLHATSVSEVESIRRFGLGQKVAMIPLGVPDIWISSHGDGTHFRERFGIDKEKRMCLFLSRIHPKKGLPLLLQSSAEIRHELAEWVLVIGGADEDAHMRTLQTLVRELDLESIVRFVGPLFGADKRNAFAAADLFVLPTYSENFGIVVAEALGAGVPVITTRGAPWEVLEQTNCGWWTEISVCAIRDALLQAIRLPRADLARMGAAGKVLVAGHYTWKIVAERLLHLYHWLLGNTDRPDFVVTD